MTEKIFHLDIVSPQGVSFSGEASSLVVPAALGYLGVLADHAPLVACLTGGRIVFREGSGKTRVLSSGANGFLEVINNKATVILDAGPDSGPRPAA